MKKGENHFPSQLAVWPENLRPAKSKEWEANPKNCPGFWMDLCLGGILKHMGSRHVLRKHSEMSAGKCSHGDILILVGGNRTWKRCR